MKYLKHFENPNKIRHDDKIVDWSFAETYVFSYYNSDELFIMKGAYTHADLLIDVYKKGKISKDTFNKYEGDFNDYYYRGECSGRLFVKDHGKPVNIISFWRFPEDNEEMKKVAKDIKEKTGIDIWQDDWKVEIIKDENLEGTTKNQSVWSTDDVDFIPVKEYKKSKERSEEEIKIPHLMSWKEKEELKKKTGWGRGWGSDLTGWGGKNPLQWRQAKYGESLQHIKSFKLFESPDCLRTFINGEIVTANVSDGYSISFTTDEKNKHIVVAFKPNQYHSTMQHDYYCRGLSEPTGSYSASCSGRLWVDKKVISFWQAPEDKEKLQTFIKEMDQELKDKKHISDNDTILDGTWYVEVEDEDAQKLEDFAGIKLKEEEYAIHLLSWEEKQKLKKEKGWGRGWGSDITGWGGKNPLQWRQAKYQENMTPRLNEDPDSLMYKDELLVYKDKDAIPFSYDIYNDDVLVGKKGSTHYQSEIGHYKYTGRLWLKSKVMSFWVYPEVDDFKIIIDSLEKKLKKKIWGNDWSIEILLKTDGKPYIGDVWDIDDDMDIKPGSFFIPIEEYVGSENVPEEQKAIHLMSWEEKQALKKKGWGKGWGSDMTAWDSKNPLQWRQSKYQEGYKMKHLKRFEFLEYDKGDILLPKEYIMDLNLMFISHELEGIIIASSVENLEDVLFFNKEGLIPDIIKRSPMTLDVLDNVEELIRYFKSHFDDSYPIIKCILKGGHIAKCEKEFYVEFYDIDEIQEIIDQITDAIKGDKDLMEMITIKEEAQKFNM